MEDQSIFHVTSSWLFSTNSYVLEEKLFNKYDFSPLHVLFTWLYILEDNPSLSEVWSIVLSEQVTMNHNTLMEGFKWTKSKFPQSRPCYIFFFGTNFWAMIRRLWKPVQMALRIFYNPGQDTFLNIFKDSWWNGD